MRRYRHGLVVAAALAAVVRTPSVWAGESSPAEQLKAEIDRVVKTLEDPALQGDARGAERRALVREIAEVTFDWTETAKRALARHWQPLTSAERQEFVKLFGGLLERSYISKIENYHGERIQYANEVVDGDLALVHTKLITKQGAEVPIEYRMIRRGDRWLVYDVVIESVSLISNYRTQFNTIIQTSSFQELVRKMRAKQDEAQYGEKVSKQ
ncbi:MAG: organic solvent tolerance ABC transporter substrate-binding protein [Candidatus Rokuibacteriota bacterium]|nr:MAG: organic solvent tolerance ABC transporter substrate-binding protein [Candidatus Rokubacteria bacterium]